MQDFLDMNSGIVSRIGYTVEFEDYTEDELLQIFIIEEEDISKDNLIKM